MLIRSVGLILGLGLGFNAQAADQLTIQQQQLKDLVVASARAGIAIRTAQPELKAALVAQRVDINAQIRTLRTGMTVGDSQVAYRMAHQILRDLHGLGSLQ